jgi:quercetin dioxygenase-like cupin family protein
MKRTTAVLAGITAALLLALLVRADAQAPASFKRTVLQQGDLAAPGREAVMALAEFQPAGASGRHTHPGDEIAYVLAGSIGLEMDGKPARTMQAGEAFMIPNGTVHNVKNMGTGPAKVIATYVIEKGKPVATPAP